MNDRQSHERILLAITAASAIVFAATVSFVVLTQTLLPAFGVPVGQPSETVLITMIGAAVTLGTAFATRLLLRRNGNGGSDGSG